MLSHGTKFKMAAEELLREKNAHPCFLRNALFNTHVFPVFIRPRRANKKITLNETVKMMGG